MKNTALYRMTLKLQYTWKQFGSGRLSATQVIYSKSLSRHLIQGRTEGKTKPIKTFLYI